MEPEAFLYLSRELSKMVNNSNSSFSKQFIDSGHYPEIIYRTMANRSYYYLYHEVKNHLIAKINDTTNLKRYIQTYGVNPEKVFSRHSRLIEFFEKLRGLFKKNPQLKESAQNVAKLLRSYKILREFADYYIATTERTIEAESGKMRVNFQQPNPAVIDYLTEDIEDVKEDIFNEIQRIFDYLNDNPHPYNSKIAQILDELSRKN